MTTQNLTTLTPGQIQELLRSEKEPNWSQYHTDTLIETALAVDSNLAFFELKTYRGTAQECDTRNRMLAIQALNKYYKGAVGGAAVEVAEEVAAPVELQAVAAEAEDDGEFNIDEDLDEEDEEEPSDSEEDESDEDSDEDSDDSDDEEDPDDFDEQDGKDAEALSALIDTIRHPVAVITNAVIESLDEEEVNDLKEVLASYYDEAPDDDGTDEDSDLESDEDIAEMITDLVNQADDAATVLSDAIYQSLDEDQIGDLVAELTSTGEDGEDGDDEEGEFDSMSDIFYADQSAIAANLVIVLSAADTKELFPQRKALASVKAVDVSGEEIVVDMVRTLAGFGSADSKSDSRLAAPKGLLTSGLVDAFNHVEHFNARDLLIAAGSAGQFIRAVNALAARLGDEVLNSFHASFDNMGLVDFVQETEHGSFNAGSFVSVRASVSPVNSESAVSTAITVFVQMRVPGMYSTRLRDKYIQSIVDYIESNEIQTPVTLMVSANATDLLFDNKLSTPQTAKAPAQTYDLQDILKQSEATQMYGFQAFSMSQLLDLAESVNRAHEDDLILDADDEDEDINSLDIDSSVGAAIVPDADFNLSILPLNGTATGMLPWGDTHALIADLNAGDVEDEESEDDDASDDMEGLDFSDE